MTALIERWNQWRRDKAVKCLRKDNAALRARIEAVSNKSDRDKKMLEEEIVRLKAHCDALIEHNAVLASSHALMNDLRDHNTFSAQEAMERMSPQYNAGSDD